MSLSAPVAGKVASNIMDTARNTRQEIFIRAPFFWDFGSEL
jgi:hypothetical protein